MNRIEKKFRELKASRKKAFIAFITAGYPNLNATARFILEFAKRGVDIIELGVPFSDPMADGPVIQEASQAALSRGTHLVDILRLVKRIRRQTQVPICLMTYYNPIFCFGDSRFIKKAKESGVDGVIIPDLPPEENRPFIRLAARAGLDVILFISPTTSRQRIKFIARLARGFIYYVSLTGTTGMRRDLPRGLAESLNTIRHYSRKPICIGFGISGPRQVQQVYKIADGAIVGSAIVKKIKENIGRADLLRRVGEFVSYLKS